MNIFLEHDNTKIYEILEDLKEKVLEGYAESTKLDNAKISEGFAAACTVIAYYQEQMFKLKEKLTRFE